MAVAPRLAPRPLLLSIIAFAGGVLGGLAAKFPEAVNVAGALGMVLAFLSGVTTRIGLWVFLCTVLSVKARTAARGAIAVFAFLTGVLVGYYLFSTLQFGFFRDRLHWPGAWLLHAACLPPQNPTPTATLGSTLAPLSTMEVRAKRRAPAAFVTVVDQ